MAITTLAGIADEMPGQTLYVSKTGTSAASGAHWAAWTGAGVPAAGAAPTLLNGHLLTDADTGALAFVNPASGRTYLARFAGRPMALSGTGVVVGGIVVVYDRLWHNLVNITSTSNQAISMSALTRYTTGDGVEAWWEVFGPYGAATPTVTLSYTDQGGAAETTGSSGAMPSAATAGRTAPFALAAGDTGVRAVTGWQASASFLSGSIGVVLRRRIATFAFHPDPRPVGTSPLDPIALTLPAVENDACLEFLFLTGTTTGAPTLHGAFHLVQG
jgi:hypothetical protein